MTEGIKKASSNSSVGKPDIHPDAVVALHNFWAEEAKIDDVRWAYREAAAVLDTFDPESIQPFDTVPLALGYPNLAKDADKVSCVSQSSWRLTEYIRQEALDRLGSRERMLAALETNPNRSKSVAQTMMEGVINDNLPPAESMSRSELRALLQICRWLEIALPNDDLPDRNRLAAAFAKADVLTPCHHLIADGFVNRVNQLSTLRSFLWKDEPSPPKMLYGIGGVGKSTLLAKFTVDEIKQHGDRLLYVPIDVDRPSVQAHRPHTFFVEAVTQIVRQIPDSEGHSESVKQHLREIGSRYSTSSEGKETEGSRYSEKNITWIEQEMVGIVRDFLSFVLPSGDSRALIAIDTFEEAQVLGSEIAEHIVQIFNMLSSAHDGVRVVFSGRIRADVHDTREDWLEPGADDILLKGLDKRSATSLLGRQLRQLGSPIKNSHLEAVIGVVGRNPMCIKLAARVIRLEGAETLLDSDMRRQLMNHLREAKIQAFLFGRILDHFQTKRIRPIAYPGLIVRRVTPKIIREVLAIPCGIDLSVEADEFDLYNDIARERTLVESDGAGGLRYRPDLRRELLPDVLDKVSSETATEIDRRAIEFYSADGSREARAEEIYHRLRLGVNLNELEERWLPGMRDLLRSSIPELPSTGRIWLARRLNISVDATTRGSASQSDWEQITALRAERYLKKGKADEALAAVRERSNRLPNSALYQLESEALRLQGDLSGARNSAERGLDATSGDRRAELLLLLASTYESEHNLDAALPMVDEAFSLADEGKDSMLGFRALITLIRLQRKLGKKGEKDRLIKWARNRLTPEITRKLRQYPRLFEETAAELGTQEPSVLIAAALKLGVQVRNAEQQEALADVLHSSWDDGMAKGVRVPKILAQNLVHEMGANKAAADELVRATEGAGLGRFTADLLKATPTNAYSSTRLTDYFRESVEQGLEIEGKLEEV